MEKAILKVNGMTCGHCEAAVAGALDKLAGVEKAKADLKKGVAAVIYDPETTSLEDMKAAIVEAGYEIEVVENMATQPKTGESKFSKME